MKSDAASVCAPLVNGVADRDMFHPAPLPELSPMSKVSVVVVERFTPVRMTGENERFPGGVTNESVPGLTVAVTTMPYVAYSAIF